MEIAVIGGGASGMFAAIAARESGSCVTVYERCDRVGRKILATGNGRCNLTNVNASEKDYHGTDTGFMRNVINSFWVEETLSKFSDMGLVCRTEDRGKVYPHCGQASAVLDVLRMKLAEDGAVIRTDFEASDISPTKNGFIISSYDGQKAYADRVIVACGGKASPSLGSNGSGYELLKKLGHRITPLKPSLVQLKTEPETVKKLKGIKVEGKLTLGGRSETGEILFTEYGISGPCAFSLSAYCEGEKYAYIDLMCEYSEEEIAEMLWTRVGIFPERRLEEFFTGMLSKRVGQTLLKYLDIAPLSRLSSTLSEEEIVKIAKTIKAWRFDVIGTMSWNNAQVTHGGALTSEFDPETLESKKVKGVYACGEILDIDGDCGGYNLQWAWASGYVAGKKCV